MLKYQQKYDSIEDLESSAEDLEVDKTYKLYSDHGTTWEVAVEEDWDFDDDVDDECFIPNEFISEETIDSEEYLEGLGGTKWYKVTITSLDDESESRAEIGLTIAEALTDALDWVVIMLDYVSEPYRD